MAKFVLAGKSDCPHFARAELLADALYRSLPNFRVHKISIIPHEWKGWLEATCYRNGWKHEESPVVWRELVDQGGKRMLLGGFSDFLEHCRDYYNFTSDMDSETMLRVAAENLETKIKLIAEEQHRLSVIKPLHIWITGALSTTSSFLIPNLLSNEVFPDAAALSLHLLDLQGSEQELKGLKMEVEDLSSSLLHQVTIDTDLEQAFHQADVILFLEECWSGDSDTKGESDEEKKEKKLQIISDRYTEYGRLINRRANADVKVIVSGDSFVNMRCSLLVDAACSMDSNQFVATASQVENEARAVIAEKLGVQTSDVTDVIVWGNITGSFYTDLQRVQVFNFGGAITGPPFFSQSLHTIFHDRKWLESEFQDLVHCRRTAVASKSSRAAAASGAHGILTILKAWNGNCGADETFSLGVVCPGFYGVPEGIVLSVPVSFTDRKWSVLLDVAVGDDLKQRLQVSTSEIRLEKERGSKKQQDGLDNRLQKGAKW
ncbi:putative malate dehydrogenase 1B [Cynoglossus semilaevis]|uniref:Malate dehydrogenase 1B, NAD (soluble) n=1 Tax=Cynoglossus semilaevis TaxID=244447 RepID=A0A3P8VLP7_CYNSE|nr:putative malate dehydrogenase 1B [Cynoglossus semilaevis]